MNNNDSIIHRSFFIKMLVSLGQKFLLFTRNSSIHGLKHVVKEEGNIAWRIFWVLVLVMCSGCLYLILMPVVVQKAEVNFTPDTRYLHWTTTFPAVTVCETFNPKMVLKQLARKYPALMQPLSYDHKRYIAELLYARGSCSRALCVPCGRGVACDVPWRDIVLDIHKTCNELITECNFNGEPFACCQVLCRVDSEYGPCYSFNTLQTVNSNQDNLYAVNRSTGPGVFSFRLLHDAQISVHSPEELSTNVLDPKFKFDVMMNDANLIEFLFTLVEIKDDPMLQSENVNVRGCRYLTEVPDETLHKYPVYSYGACKLAKITEKSFEQCACVHPARESSYKSFYCNYTGLNCLVNYEAFPIKLDVNQDNAADCLPSCSESELTTIDVSRRRIDEELGKGILVKVRMAGLPTLRYQRNLLRTRLDLVVSIGGLVGLFFSASVLSFLEAVYLIFRKHDN